MLHIEIDRNSGFCSGVTAAIRKAEQVLADGTPLQCLGDIVHNGSECLRLRDLGLHTITHDDLDTLPAGTKVLLRAHGEPPRTYRIAESRGIHLIDATCPVVLHLQRRIRQEFEADPDRQIVIYGKRGHAEVLGLVGQTDSRAVVIETPQEALSLNPHRDTTLFSQTTMPLEGFQQIVSTLQRHIQAPAAFRSHDTICRSVVGRLPRLQEFAARHDVVIFVCGLKSSNGKVLHEACCRVNPRSHLVDRPEAIEKVWFDGAKTVGICGATSTPLWLMEACCRRVQGIDAQ